MNADALLSTSAAVRSNSRDYTVAVVATMNNCLFSECGNADVDGAEENGRVARLEGNMLC